MNLPDFFRDEVLKLPQVRVVDSDGLKRGHGLEQILRAGPGMSAGAGQDRCNLVQRPFGLVRNIVGLGIEAEGAERTVLRVSCYGHLGRTREAQEMVARILALDPTFRISTARRGVWSDADTAHIVEGMRLAGLPE